jgi:hypothetical protein
MTGVAIARGVQNANRSSDFGAGLLYDRHVTDGESAALTDMFCGAYGAGGFDELVILSTSEVFQPIDGQRIAINGSHFKCNR